MFLTFRADHRIIRSWTKKKGSTLQHNSRQLSAVEPAHLDDDPVDGLAWLGLCPEHGEDGRVLTRLCDQPEDSAT